MAIVSVLAYYLIIAEPGSTLAAQPTNKIAWGAVGILTLIVLNVLFDGGDRLKPKAP